MLENKQFRDFVLDIYGAVADHEQWPELFDRLAELVNARGCILFEWQNDGTDRKLRAPLMTSGYKPELLMAYLDKYADREFCDQDLFEHHSMALDGIVLTDESRLSRDEAEYLAQPHVKEMLSYDIRHRYGCLLDKDNTYRARFALQTSAARGKLNSTDNETLAALLPHVAKALDLSSPLGMTMLKKQALMAIIERLPFGVCVLDSKGRVELNNTEFSRQEEQYQAFWTDQQNRLILHENADRPRFKKLLTDALNHGCYGARPRKEAIMINSNDSAGALCLELVPMKELSELGSGLFNGALLFSRDTSKPINIDIELAGLSFNLTKTECEITQLICEGLTNSEIAARRDRSIETINSQVKTIFSKSGVTNRTQLVRLLCNFNFGTLTPKPV